MKIGIDQFTEQRIISGARVAFDTRGTKEAHETRSPVSKLLPRTRRRRNKIAKQQQKESQK